MSYRGYSDSISSQRQQRIWRGPGQRNSPSLAQRLLPSTSLCVAYPERNEVESKGSGRTVHCSGGEREFSPATYTHCPSTGTGSPPSTRSAQRKKRKPLTPIRWTTALTRRVVFTSFRYPTLSIV